MPAGKIQNGRTRFPRTTPNYAAPRLTLDTIKLSIYNLTASRDEHFVITIRECDLLDIFLESTWQQHHAKWF